MRLGSLYGFVEFDWMIMRVFRRVARREVIEKLLTVHGVFYWIF